MQCGANFAHGHTRENILGDSFKQRLLHFHDYLAALAFARVKNDGASRVGLRRIGTTAVRVALEVEFLFPKFVSQKNRTRCDNDAQCDYFLPIHAQKILPNF